MSDKLKTYEKIDHAAVKVTYTVALAILLGLLVWGAYTFLQFRKYEYTNDAQVKSYINPILSRASGYVDQIRYTDHQQVHKGDTLLLLDINEARVQLQQAKAALATAEAQLKVLQSHVKTTRGGATVDQAKIAAAEAQLWQQQKEFDRYQNLLKTEAVTRQQFEAVQTRLEVARSNYEAVKNTLGVSIGKTRDVNAQIAVAEADIEQRKAAVERCLLDLKYAVITAPSNGFMGSRTIQEGQYIQKGQTIGFMVDKNQGKWIVANFEETQIAQMHEGQAAKITIDAYPDAEFRGQIESISPATGAQFSLLPPDNATGNFVKITQRFPIKICFADDNPMLDKLRAGMNAEVSVLRE
ncbi:HlyD family secretion protein [Mangrovibacterium marinum]|uniref:HlyD family secretion protein n=1 Tax=Mangrovibacterium marinum TaxID=1639118 RepID=UPI002A18DEEB|nr:HlyD family secretion protein [Mangrovibacterium marinum]